MKSTVIVLIRDPELRSALSRGFRTSGHEVVARFQSEGWTAMLRGEPVSGLVVGDDIADADPSFIERKAAQIRPELNVIRVGPSPEEGDLELSVNGEAPSRVAVAEAVSWIEQHLQQPNVADSDVVEASVLASEAEGQPVRICGRNPHIARILRIIDTVAPTSSTVLIQGESGTGKDLFAHLVHQKSRRANGPWVSVNCGAIPAELMESELFGHERGAFTGADQRKDGLFVAADGGTLFLDEIGEMPLDTQVKLLRVLQSGSLRPVGSTRSEKVDVRIIAATNKDLKDEVRSGRFRLDLFYRLNVISVNLPALRDRIEDLPELVDSIVERITHKGIDAVQLPQSTLDILAEHNWSGNIRELENIVERVLLLFRDEAIPDDELRQLLSEASLDPIEDPQSASSPAAVTGSGNPILYREDMTLKELEEAHIRHVLGLTKGNKTQAARALGINVKTLYNKMKAMGLTREEFVTA